MRWEKKLRLKHKLLHGQKVKIMEKIMYLSGILQEINIIEMKQ